MGLGWRLILYMSNKCPSVDAAALKTPALNSKGTSSRPTLLSRVNCSGRLFALLSLKSNTQVPRDFDWTGLEWSLVFFQELPK